MAKQRIHKRTSKYGKKFVAGSAKLDIMYFPTKKASVRRNVIKNRLTLYPIGMVYNQLSYKANTFRGTKYEDVIKSDIDWLANYLYKIGEIKTLEELSESNKMVGK